MASDRFSRSAGGAAPAGTCTPTGTTGVPTARRYSTAVWTGSKMIVWGGSSR
jgi:hypothetical protein